MLKKYSKAWSQRLILNVKEEKDRFCEIFYSYVIFSSFDSINEMNKKRIINYKNTELLYKIFAMYYTISFSDFIDEKRIEEMSSYMYDLYNMDDKDKNNFKNLLKINKENKLLFQISFVNLFSKDILYIERKKIQEVCIISNFFKNSYNIFMKTYNKYMNLKFE